MSSKRCCSCGRDCDCGDAVTTDAVVSFSLEPTIPMMISPKVAPIISIAPTAGRKVDGVDPRLDGIEVARPELTIRSETGEHEDLIGESRERGFLLVGKL